MQHQFLIWVGCVFAISCIGASVHAGTVTPSSGSDTFGPGVPTASSSPANPYVLVIYYFAADGTLASLKVNVPNIQAAPKNPTAAQAAMASAAKAAAIVAAINAAMIPGVTASVNPGTMQGQYYTGALNPMTGKPQLATFQQSFYTVNGTRDSVWEGKQIVDGSVANQTPGRTSYTGPNATLGPGVYKLSDPTKEPGNGTMGRNKKGGNPPGSMNQGLDIGTGASTGFSTGQDPLGDPSVVGFGFIDESTATPTNYIEAFTPAAGQTDAQVLGTLATLFTTDFASLGYTATYDSVSDSVAINQPLSEEDMLWDADSDTGLNFSAVMLEVPEPAGTMLLFGTIGLWACSYRGSRRVQESNRH